MRPLEHIDCPQVRRGIMSSAALTLVITSLACPKSGGPSQPPGTGGSSSGGSVATATGGSNSGTGGSASGTGGNSTGGASSGTGGSPPGSGGGNPVGTGGSAGTTAGSCVGALLCENFEAYTTGNAPAAPWKISTNLGTVRVDTTHALSGTKAVRFTTDGAAGTYRRAFMSIEGAPVFPVAGNVFYGRMMVWLTAAPAGSMHWTNIQGEGPVPNMNFRAFSRYGGQLQKRLMANYETQGVASDCWKHSTTTMPEGRWTCMEWRFNGPNNEMNFWLDGASLSDITVVGRGEGCISQGTTGTWYSPTYDTIRLGWEHYQQSIAHDMWIDDVAIDTKRIGCPP